MRHRGLLVDRSRYIRLACCLGIGLMMFAVGQAMAEERSRTLAVIGVAGESSQLAADRLRTALAADESIALVDPARLSAITPEQRRSLASAELAARVAVGKEFGANWLVLIRPQQTLAGERARLTLCDTSLGTEVFLRDYAHGDQLVADSPAMVQAVLARFPAGVTAMVTLPDFASRDERTDFHHLQADFAHLLRETLAGQRGLAVVDLEAMRALAAATAQAGGEGKRPATLLLEGQYRTERTAKAGPTIQLHLRLRQPARPAVEIVSPAIRLEQAGEFLLAKALPATQQALGLEAEPAVDRDRQFNNLVALADRFAQAGDPETAARWIETALLLRPERDAQRIRLVNEYTRWNVAPGEVWPAVRGDSKETLPLASVAPATEAQRQQVDLRLRVAWRRGLHHLEHLIRNRRLSSYVGAKLANDAIHSLAGGRDRGLAPRGDEERLRKEFLRQVAAGLFPERDESGPIGQHSSTAAEELFQAVFCRVDDQPISADDLELCGDLLCELLPANVPATPSLVEALRAGTNPDSALGVKSTEWFAFARRLTDSPRPLASAAGRLAVQFEKQHRLKVKGSLLLDGAKLLSAELAKAPLKPLDPTGAMAAAAAASEQELAAAAARETAVAVRSEPRPPVKPAFPNPPAGLPINPPAPAAQQPLQCEQLVLTPIDPTVRTVAGELVRLSEHRWRSSSGFGSWRELVPAWNGIDVIYAHGALIFLSGNAGGQEVYVGERVMISHVVFDGEYLWVSCGYDEGVHVYDRTGRQVAHARPKDGLPISYAHRPLVTLGKGRALAAGSIGQAGDGWIALIEVSKGGAKVKVIHEAPKEKNFKNRTPEVEADPTTQFEPSWMISHQDQRGKQWIFIDRPHNESPLLVDGETLDVRVYPLDTAGHGFPRYERPEGAFLSHQGTLYVAGSRNDFNIYRFNSEVQYFEKLTDLRSAKDHHYGNATAGRVLMRNDYLYYVGQARWIRYHTKTRGEQVLIDNPRSLPNYGSGSIWNVANSQCFGLVAYGAQKLYHLKVVGD